MKAGLEIFKEALKGKSLYRTLSNQALSEFTIKGKCIDLGARDGRASYYRYLKSDSAEMTFVDREQREGVIQADLEKSLKVKDNQFDCALAMNVLEHIYNYKGMISEIYRILKPDGFLIGCVPFLVNVHPDPNDYFRFTRQTLEKDLLDSGFKDIQIKEIGFGPFSAAASISSSPLNSLRVNGVSYLMALGMDYFAGNLFAKTEQWKMRYPLGYIFKAKKLLK